MMLAAVPANQMRRAATDAILIHSLLESLGDIGMIGKAEIIVAAKIDDFSAVDNQFNALRRVDNAAGTL